MRKRNIAATGVLGVFLIGGVTTACNSGTDHPAERKPAAVQTQTHTTTPKPDKPAKKKGHTVEYIVTGSNADVQYGTSGSTHQGHSGQDVVNTLTGSPLYLSVTAQLQGGGHVSCTIKVDGKTVAKASADGGYNIAMCEATKDLFGHWQDVNS